MRPWTPLLPLTLIVLGFTIADTRACVCAGYSTADKAFNRSGAVFLGEVIEIRPILFHHLSQEEKLAWSGGLGGIPDDLPIDNNVRFAVQEAWKGLSGLKETVIRSTLDPQGTCGFPFKIGKRYVVFAYQGTDSLVAGTCSGTDVFEDSTAMIRYLRRKSRGDHRSIVAGWIGDWGNDNPAGMVRDSTGRLLPVTLSLQGPGMEKRTRPQAGGRFEFDGLRPGTYKLNLELPFDYDPHPFEYRVELVDPIDFAEVYVSSPNLPAGGIGLSIRDAAGRSLPTMMLFLDDSKSRAYIENGVLKASHLSPGRYTLAFPLDGSSSGDRIYYPNTEDPDEAQIIEIEAGQITRLPEWRLPFEVEPTLLEGVVLLPDGHPASGATVALNADMLFHWTSADQDGRFQLRYYLPFRYQLEANAKAADQSKDFRLAPMPWPPEEPPSSSVRLILQ